MKFDPQKHHRRSIRLKEFDYSAQGAYYVTIATHHRQHAFGEIVNDEMQLNQFGQIARDEWFKAATLRPYVELNEGEFVVMPNHVHGIIWIYDDSTTVGARRRRAPTTIEQFGKPVPHSIPTIIRAYKSAVTYAVNGAQDQRGTPLWQTNYYEHVIRNEEDLRAKCDYIACNPLYWEDDDEYI